MKKDEAAFLEMMLNSISAQVTTEVVAPSLIAMANARTSAEKSEYGLLIQRAEAVQDWIKALIYDVKRAVEKALVEKIRRDEMFDWDRKLASLETKLIDCRYVGQRLKDQKIVDAVIKIINRVESLRAHIKKWW